MQTTERKWEAPVPGSAASVRSTSGDVHLYADPATIGQATPMLYTGQFPYSSVAPADHI